jgi:voltage-gated potassium channel
MAMDGVAPAESFRRRLCDLLEGGRRSDPLSGVLNIGLMSIILANVAGSVAETVPSVNARYGHALALFDGLCVAIYIIEYVARLWAAPEHPALQDMPPWRARLKHALSPMLLLDLVAISPIFLEIFVGSDLAVVRILRLVRFYRLARYSTALTTFADVIASEWRALAGSGLLFGGLLLFSGVAMYFAEGTKQPDRLGDIPHAMWWAVVTLSTVGYGDIVPITVAGKMIAGMTMLFGIVFFALPVGIIATSFQQQMRRRDFIVSFAMVANVPLFRRLDPVSVASLVELLTARRVAIGDVIITKGETADAMYFIASGRVRVQTPSGPVYLSEGDFFGEVALIVEGERRTANVTAASTCELLVLSARDFRNLVNGNEDIANAVRDVANQRLDELRRGKPAQD